MWNNKVFLGGARLTADPEVKVIGENGNKVANFRVAVNRRLVKGQEHAQQHALSPRGICKTWIRIWILSYSNGLVQK